MLKIKVNGIYRVDNDKGYVKDNVVTACKFCNFAKHTSTVEEFKHWLDWIKENG